MTYLVPLISRLFGYKVLYKQGFPAKSVMKKRPSLIGSVIYKISCMHESHAYTFDSMQCVALCCTVLQCVAVCCSVSCIHESLVYHTLQHTATHCRCMHDDSVCNTHIVCTMTRHHMQRLCRYVAVCCSVLQCVAVCCSVLQCVTVCCSVLQCVGGAL